MGLAASQARLLALTSRQHTLEGRAQRIMADKQRLANDSNEVYEKYITTLDEVQIKTRRTDAFGKDKWLDASINNLLNLENFTELSGTTFFLQNMSNGKIYLPQMYGTAYDASSDKYDFAEKFGVTYTVGDRNEKELNDYENAIAAGWNDPSKYSETSYQYRQFKELEKVALNHRSDPYLIPNDYRTAQYYEEIYDAVSAAGGWIEVPESRAKSVSWVTNMVKNVQAIINTWDSEQEILSKTADALHYNLREEANSEEIRKADQKYEDDIATINQKDARYDTQLQKLEAERESIRTEIDGLKRIASDNVERTFKVFS